MKKLLLAALLVFVLAAPATAADGVKKMLDNNAPYSMDWCLTYDTVNSPSDDCMTLIPANSNPWTSALVKIAGYNYHSLYFVCTGAGIDIDIEVLTSDDPKNVAPLECTEDECVDQETGYTNGTGGKKEIMWLVGSSWLQINVTESGGNNAACKLIVHLDD